VQRSVLFDRKIARVYESARIVLHGLRKCIRVCSSTCTAEITCGLTCQVDSKVLRVRTRSFPDWKSWRALLG